MTESSSIENFIGNLAAIGELYSQSEEFTISEDAALAKLSGVLEDKQHWVLKAMQAGVAANCSKISVKIRKKETTIVWYGLPPVEASLLRKALSQSKPTGDIFIDELVTGLRAVLGLCAFQFGSLGILTAAADRTLAADDQDHEQPTLSVDHPGDTVIGFRSKSQREAAADQASFLAKRCLLCPVPIELDGRSIQGDREKSLCNFKGNHYSRSPLLLIDVEAWKDPSGWRVSSQPLIQEDFSVRNWNNIPVTNEDTGSGARGRLLVWTAIEEHNVTEGRGKNRTTEKRTRAIDEPGTIYWLRHGVICEVDTIYKEKSLGMALALEAREARSDLSGLAIGARPLSEEAVGELLSRLYELAQEPLKTRLASQLSDFGFPLLREIPDRLFYAFCGSLGAGLLFALLGWLVNLVVPITDAMFNYVGGALLIAGALSGFVMIPDSRYTGLVKQSLSGFKLP